MHVTHSKIRRNHHSGSFKFICNPELVLRSSICDIEAFCAINDCCLEINDGNMQIVVEEK